MTLFHSHRGMHVLAIFSITDIAELGTRGFIDTENQTDQNREADGQTSQQMVKRKPRLYYQINRSQITRILISV